MTIERADFEVFFKVRDLIDEVADGLQQILPEQIAFKHFQRRVPAPELFQEEPSSSLTNPFDGIQSVEVAPLVQTLPNLLTDSFELYQRALSGSRCQSLN